MGRLIINAILGVILLFLTNLVLAEDIPINLLTVIICAIGGGNRLVSDPLTSSFGGGLLKLTVDFREELF